MQLKLLYKLIIKTIEQYVKFRDKHLHCYIFQQIPNTNLAVLQVPFCQTLA